MRAESVFRIFSLQKCGCVAFLSYKNEEEVVVDMQNSARATAPSPRLVARVVHDKPAFLRLGSLPNLR